ncbi:hypothetical protein V6O07_21670, partial [Arthrospira platensis SPKY2]
GWLRSSDGTLEVIDEPENWTSPRLGIRFELKDGNFTIYRPDGERFLTPTELAKQVQTERQRAEAAEDRVRELEERLRQLEGDRHN